MSIYPAHKQCIYHNSQLKNQLRRILFWLLTTKNGFKMLIVDIGDAAGLKGACFLVTMSLTIIQMKRPSAVYVTRKLRNPPRSNNTKKLHVFFSFYAVPPELKFGKPSVINSEIWGPNVSCEEDNKNYNL